MKKPTIKLKDHPHGGGLQKFTSEPLGARIARMLATHTVEAATCIADYDDAPQEPSKSMDVRPEADMHLDPFDRAEMMFEKGLGKLEEQTLQQEIARQAIAQPDGTVQPSVNTEA